MERQFAAVGLRQGRRLVPRDPRPNASSSFATCSTFIACTTITACATYAACAIFPASAAFIVCAAFIATAGRLTAIASAHAKSSFSVIGTVSASAHGAVRNLAGARACAAVIACTSIASMAWASAVSAPSSRGARRPFALWTVLRATTSDGSGAGANALRGGRASHGAVLPSFAFVAAAALATGRQGTSRRTLLQF